MQASYYQVISKITFINEELIPADTWLKSEAICNPIDIDDLDFIALSIFIQAYLWTGDKQLYNGLKLGNEINVLNTLEIKVLSTNQM